MKILIRTILGSFILSLLASLAFGQGVFVPPQVALNTVNGITRPIAQATITVCAAGASGIPCSPVLVGAIFKDAGLSQPLSNPFTSDTSGNYNFAAAALTTFTVTVTAPGYAGFSYQITTGGGSGGGITGCGGTPNFLAIWTGSSVLCNSLLSDNGTSLTYAGTATTKTFYLSGANPAQIQSVGETDIVGARSTVSGTAGSQVQILGGADSTNLTPGAQIQVLGANNSPAVGGTIAITAASDPETGGKGGNVNIGAGFGNGSLPANSGVVQLTTTNSALVNTQSTFVNLANICGALNGCQTYCTDCNSTCSAGSSTGRTCFKENGVWVH